MALSVTNFTDQAIILVENIPAENSQINLWKRLIMAMYKDGYKNSDGYEYREGCWHKDDKDYDYGKDGKYHEYTHDYKNDEGYQYWEGSYHKDGKDYDYGKDGKYHEYTHDYKNDEGYQYWGGSYHKGDKDYDYGKDGKYHEYMHDYKNDEGYQYWGGSYHKGGKDYDYDYGKYVEHTDSHASGDYHLSTEYPADHAY
jgi:hypothetical protein